MGMGLGFLLELDFSDRPELDAARFRDFHFRHTQLQKGARKQAEVVETEIHRVLLRERIVLGAEYLAATDARDQAAFTGMALMQGIAYAAGLSWHGAVGDQGPGC